MEIPKTPQFESNVIEIEKKINDFRSHVESEVKQIIGEGQYEVIVPKGESVRGSKVIEVLIKPEREESPTRVYWRVDALHFGEEQAMKEIKEAVISWLEADKEPMSNMKEIRQHTKRELEKIEALMNNEDNEAERKVA